eukprot:COSAG01_NODE_1013_length_12138_cov_7.073926_14_plen_156_part_00
MRRRRRPAQEPLECSRLIAVIAPPIDDFSGWSRTACEGPTAHARLCQHDKPSGSDIAAMVQPTYIIWPLQVEPHKQTQQHDGSVLAGQLHSLRRADKRDIWMIGACPGLTLSCPHPPRSSTLYRVVSDDSFSVANEPGSACLAVSSWVAFTRTRC